jgi:hypothetical protein
VLTVFSTDGLFQERAVKTVLLIISLAISTQAMSADEKDYTAMLRDKGFKYCAASLNNVANWLIDHDGMVISQWNEVNAEGHVGTMIGSKRYSDGNAIMYLNGIKTSNEGCDITFTQVIPTDSSCTDLREKAFKEWKYFHDLMGIPVYEDPTSANVSMMLQPIGTGCVITKTGVLFLDKADLK